MHNVTGHRFGRWVAIDDPQRRGKGHYYCRCRCDCGTERDVYCPSLTRGVSLSCGCHKAEVTGRRARSHGDARPGKKRERLYTTWASMHGRCRNPNNKSFARYGGRGIRVCDDWTTYPPFREWALGAGYTDALTIDRIDNDRGYSPGNCRWVTIEEQQRNRSNTRH